MQAQNRKTPVFRSLYESRGAVNTNGDPMVQLRKPRVKKYLENESPVPMQWRERGAVKEIANLPSSRFLPAV
jgi:hypothetical protein